MSSSCMGKELPKEKKWGIKNCRALKCPELRKNGNTNYPDDEPERCQVFGTMPGTLPCCIQDMDNLPPEEFLRHCVWQLHEPWEKKFSGNRKTPGPKNCPASCPYKISEQGEVFGKSGEAQWKKKPGTIWKCAFTGGVLGQGHGASCPCHVLDNPRQEEQIETLRQIIEDSRKPATQALKCSNEFCPDGALRCAVGETTCPVIKLPLADMKVCPLWRIPAKLLPATIAQIPEKTEEPGTTVVSSPPEMTQKEKTPTRKSSQKEKPEKAAKKKGDKILEHKPEGKYLYTIRISRRKDTPGEYVLECMKHKGQPHGVIHMGATGETVTETVPDYLAYWAGMDCPAPDPYNKPDGNLQYEDETGLFPAYLFFNNDGTAKKITSKEKPAPNENQKRAKAIRVEVHQVREEMKRLSEGKSRSPKQRKKKEPEDPPLRDVRIPERWFICRVCENEEIGKNRCKLQTMIPPVGCTAVSRTGDIPEGAPVASWEPWDGKTTTLHKKEKKAVPEAVQNATLFDFDPIDGDTHVPCSGPEVGACKDCDEPECQDKPKPPAEPADPATEARPVELHAACLDCEAVDRCMRHDPHANCLQEFLDFEKVVEEAKKEDKTPTCPFKTILEMHSAGKKVPQVSRIALNPKNDKVFINSRTLKDVKKSDPPRLACEALGISCENCEAYRISLNCCDNCKGGYENPEVITMDCPDYSDISSGKIDKEKLREDTRRLGCSYWSAPGSPPKIPNVWGYCVGRGCKSISSVDGICTTTGQKVKDMTYCPTQHQVGKQPKNKDPLPPCTDSTKACPESCKGCAHDCERKPEKYVQHCCGTCGHHKGHKSFHESCPRLGEMLFKKGTKSAKVLMEETQREICKHWITKPVENLPAKTHEELFQEAHEKNVATMGLKKDSRQWFAALTTSKRRSCPGWFWEVWKIDPKKKGEWLYEGGRTEREANETKERLEADEFHKGSRFEVRKRPDLCEEQNSMGGCLNGGWSCHNNTPERRKAVGCFVPVRPQGEKKPPKKPASKKPLYGIKITYTPKDSTAYNELGCKYSLDITGPHCGNAGGQKTREDLIRSALSTLEFWNVNKPVKITKTTARFDDRTGEFTIDDFFKEDGTLHPAPKTAEPTKKPRKTKTKKESENP